MWITRLEPFAGGCGFRLAFESQDGPASYASVVEAWQFDPSFRSHFNESLAEVPFSAFRWETPPATSTLISRPFDCVLLDDPGLDRRQDPDAFAEHFRDATGPDVVRFPNLGGDAIMVVPRPISPGAHYGHLAAFVRDAPEAQRQELWRVVGEQLSGRIGSRPVWLSTAGAGVAWLHVRLDDRPKYYGFAPYRLVP